MASSLHEGSHAPTPFQTARFPASCSDKRRQPRFDDAQSTEIPTCGQLKPHDRPRSAARRLRPHRRILHPPRHRARGPACQREDRQGRDRGDRRRIRLRQVGHVLRGDAHSRPRRPHRRRRGAFHRPRYPRRQRRPDAQPARARNVDDLSEPARGAQPHPQGRTPDRGCPGAAFAGGFVGGDGQGHRDPRPGAHRPTARALPCLSVRALAAACASAS